MPKTLEPATRDYTINLHRLCHGTQFKKKAPKALKVIRAAAAVNMSTEDVRIDVRLNQFVWSKGVRNIPKRVRVRMIRRKNEEDESGTSFFTLCQLVKVNTFKGLRTEKNTGGAQ